jgi:hypothetical protein
MILTSGFPFSSIAKILQYILQIHTIDNSGPKGWGGGGHKKTLSGLDIAKSAFSSNQKKTGESRRPRLEFERLALFPDFECPRNKLFRAENSFSNGRVDKPGCTGLKLWPLT